MSSAPILITGATGRLGKLVVERLIALGQPLRIFTRRPDVARTLFGSSVQISVGEFADRRSLDAAMRGVGSVFLLSPISPRLAADQIAVADAAASGGVRRIVKMSGSDWTIEPSGSSISGDAHAAIERYLGTLPLESVSLRPNAWMQVSLANTITRVLVHDPVMVANLDAGVGYIDARDIADVAVHQLLSEVTEPGSVNLTGPDVITPRQIADLIAEKLGRPVDAAEKPLVLAPDADFEKRAVAQFTTLIAAGRAAVTTDTVAALLARAPRSVEAFISEYLAAEASPAKVTYRRTSILMANPTRKLNINVGINTTGYLPNAWKYRTGTRHDINDPDYYRRLTELAHKGLFDAVFLSDHPALMTDPNGRPFHTIDPLILSTSLAAQVPDIGFVATMSSTYNSPYNLARRTQSTDIMSGGRLIINIVSSFNPNVAANFGSEPLPARAERYAKASEFLDVAKQLWSSWDPAREGEIADGRFWDSTTAQTIDHEGTYFTVRGPLNVPIGPQGHPVIAQAGASEGGIDLAARHGEIIYCNILSRGAGQAFGKKVRDRAVSFGRDPAGIRIVPGLVVILGETREEAFRKHELFSGAGSEDGLIARFIRENGIDPNGFDPDAVLEAARFIPDPNRIQAVGMGLGLVDLLTHEKLTTRQAVRRSEGHHRLVLGTPEEVADGIIDLWADGTVDGYTLQPPRAPDDIQEFVDQVVPILQDRGVYRTRYEEKTVRERYGLPFPEPATRSRQGGVIARLG